VLYTRKLTKGAVAAAARKKTKQEDAPAQRLLAIDEVRKRSREKEAKAREAAEKKHMRDHVEFAEKTHTMLRQIKAGDDELLAAFNARRESELELLNIKYDRKVRRAAKAIFPDPDAINWSAQVLQFNFTYWLDASAGVQPAIPKRGKKEEEEDEEEEEEEDDDSNEDDDGSDGED
jgi:hypothetical protein